MRTIYTFLLVIFSISLYNCNPKTLLNGSAPKSNVDSVLFYQQSDLSDPFLDEVKTNPGNEVKLKTNILPPPPPPPPDYREIEGFRVQVFAGTDSVNAGAIKNQVSSLFDQKVYLENEGGLFKVQAGDYPYRTDADNAKIQLNQNGFSGAWVVKRMIRVALDSTSGERLETSANPDSQSGSVSTQPQGTFRIQVLASSDVLKAKEAVFNLKNQFNVNAFYETSGNLFKVFIGYFETRDKAENFLAKVRNGGYPDAWLVY